MATPKTKTVDPSTGELVEAGQLGLPVVDPGDVAGRLDLLRENTGDSSLDLTLLPRIVMPSGDNTVWKIQSLTGEEYLDSFDLIVCWSGTARTYWAEPLGQGDKWPDCASTDGKTGFGTPGGECRTCQFAMWGSAVDLKGQPTRAQACREQRIIVGLVLPHLVPMVLRISPTSVKAWASYTQLVSGYGFHLAGVVTRCGLSGRVNVGGIGFAAATFTVAGTITGDHLDAVRAFAELVRQSAAQGRSVTALAAGTDAEDAGITAYPAARTEPVTPVTVEGGGDPF